MMAWKRLLPLKMAIFGIYVRFLGCTSLFFYWKVDLFPKELRNKSQLSIPRSLDNFLPCDVDGLSGVAQSMEKEGIHEQKSSNFPHCLFFCRRGPWGETKQHVTKS